MYRDQEWEAVYDGFGVGIGTSSAAQADTFSFTFRCLSEPRQPLVRGHLRDTNPHLLGDDSLIRALTKALDKANS